MTDTEGINIPSKQSIAEWNDITTMPIMETAPKSAPASVFVHFPNDSILSHAVYAGSNLTAKKDLLQIRELNDLIKIGDSFISKLYSRRSIANPLIQFFGRAKTQPAPVVEAVKPHYQELFELVQATMVFTKDASLALKRIFDSPQWTDGLYSDNLIDTICLLFDRLAILDEIHLDKSAITNDLTILMNITGTSDPSEIALQSKNAEIRQWLATHCSIENTVATDMKNVSDELKKTIFTIFFTHIKSAIETHSYLIPEMLYTYLRSLIMLLRFCPVDPSLDVAKFLEAQARLHPLLPLCFEMSTNFGDRITKMGVFKIPELPPMTRNFIDLTSIKNELLQILNDLPGQISCATRDLITPEQFQQQITDAIISVGNAKNAVREQLCLKLALPPEDPEISSPFERSLRKGYSEQELHYLLQTITLWRSIVDLLRNSATQIHSVLGPTFHYSMQNDVKNNLEKLIGDTKSKDMGGLDNVITQLRVIVGDFQEGEDLNPQPTKKRKEHPIQERKAFPSPAMLEFYRIQLQHVSNAKIKARAVQDLQNKSREIVQKTRLWTDIIMFDQLLQDIGDQSDLYFKETQLDLNKVVNFPIRASLPFILCEYALDNYMKPELTEQIFYPIGIYDDAAYKAEHSLSSKFLLDEIKAESEICLRTLSTLISDFTFGAFRTYASLRYLPPDVYQSLHAEFSDHWPGSRAYRLSTLLQQNSFYLHTKLIDLKSLIVAAIDSEVIRSVNSLINLIERSGISALIAMSKGLEIIRLTHQLLCEQGIALINFDTILRSAIGDASPVSFSSEFLSTVALSIVHTASKCYLRSNPLRLLPLSKKTLSPAPFGARILGKIMKSALEPTVSIVTNEHFSCLMRLLDDGAVAFLAQCLNEQLNQNFAEFVALYTKVKPDIKRIKDAPLGTAGQLVFDRYDGVYRYFTTDQNIQQLLRKMKEIGNMLSMAHMLDIAVESKRLSRAQIVSYIKGGNLDGSFSNDLTQLFPEKQTIDLVMSQDPIPRRSDIYPRLFTMMLATIIRNVRANDIFLEKSNTILDFTSLTGLASAWSVLEFVFCLLEIIRPSDAPSSFELYGEGVMMAAAALICAAKQDRLYFATSIGRRLARIKDVDFASTSDLRLVKFCAVYELEHNSYEWAKSVIQPIMNMIDSIGADKIPQ